MGHVRVAQLRFSSATWLLILWKCQGSLEVRQSLDDPGISWVVIDVVAKGVASSLQRTVEPVEVHAVITGADLRLQIDDEALQPGRTEPALEHRVLDPDAVALTCPSNPSETSRRARWSVMYSVVRYRTLAP